MKQMHFINVVPFFPDDPDTMVQQAIRIADEVGLKRIAFCLMLHPSGTPARQKSRFYADAFRILKTKLAGRADLEAGILLQSIIGHGWSGPVSMTDEPWQKTVLKDGAVTARHCPMDAGFRDYILEAIRWLGASAPAFFLVDDDFCVKQGECFCPLHMDAFRQRLGRDLTREQLVNALESVPGSDPLAQGVTAVLDATLVSFAHEIRTAIDDSAPGPRCGFCCPGGGQYSLAPIARALAGKTRPFIRIACAIYGGESPLSLNAMSRYTAVRKLAAEDVDDLIAESDTFPHNRYSMSASALHAHITLSILNGLNGSKLWNTVIYDNAPESGKAYEQIMARHMKFYDALLTAVDGVVWQGAKTPLADHRRNYHPLRPGACFFFPDFITSLLGRFGVSTGYDHTLAPCTRLLCGTHVDGFTDDELNAFLGASLLLDGKAAERMEARGFAALTGVRTESSPECFHNVEVHGRTGERAHFAWQPGATVLRPLEGAAEITTLYRENIEFSRDRTRQGAGMVFFRNPRGGRVATVSFQPDMPFYKTLLPQRRTFLIEALDYLAGGQMPFVLESEQDVVLRQGTGTDGRHLLGIFNLSQDALAPVRLRSAAPLQRIQQLQPDGLWRDLHANEADHPHYALNLEAAPLQPLILRCEAPAGFTSFNVELLRHAATRQKRASRVMPNWAGSP